MRLGILKTALPAFLGMCAAIALAGSTEIDGSTQADITTRITGTASANQQLGTINFYGFNTAGTPAQKNYAQISGKLVSPSSAAESGALRILTMVAGALTEKGKFDSNGLSLPSLNAGGVVKAAATTGQLSVVSALNAADLPSSILYNNGGTTTNNYNFDSGTLFIDASGNKVGSGTTSPTAALHAFSNSTGGGAVNIGSVLTVESFDPNILLQDRSSGDEFALHYDNPELTMGKYSGTTYAKLFYFGTDGQLGIGHSASYGLDVNAVMRLDEVSSPSSPASGVLLYSNSGTSGAKLMVKDANGNTTQLNSHASPDELDAEALSSFSDPEVALPFSFHHENAYVGKGEIVDMAKLVKYVEAKMVAELGPQAGKVKWDYDLPADEIRSAEDYQTSQTQQQVARALEALSKMPPVKVQLGPDRTIPGDAVVTTTETTVVARNVEITEDVLDLDAMKVVTVTRQQIVREEVATGRILKSLKPGWIFKDGELYRPATVDDVDVQALVHDNPRLPDWILSRISSPVARGASVGDIVAEIKKMRHAKAGAVMEKVAQSR